jgi:hypothetical protein
VLTHIQGAPCKDKSYPDRLGGLLIRTLRIYIVPIWFISFPHILACHGELVLVRMRVHISIACILSYINQAVYFCYRTFRPSTVPYVDITLIMRRMRGAVAIT